MSVKLEFVLLRGSVKKSVLSFFFLLNQYGHSELQSVVLIEGLPS